MADEIKPTFGAFRELKDHKTRWFRVEKALPAHSVLFSSGALVRPVSLPAVGEIFSYWPWGEKIGFVFGRGPIVAVGEIQDWLVSGALVEISPPK